MSKLAHLAAVAGATAVTALLVLAILWAPSWLFLAKIVLASLIYVGCSITTVLIMIAQRIRSEEQ